jgi:hypothetical protein
MTTNRVKLSTATYKELFGAIRSLMAGGDAHAAAVAALRLRRAPPSLRSAVAALRRRRAEARSAVAALRRRRAQPSRPPLLVSNLAFSINIRRVWWRGCSSISHFRILKRRNLVVFAHPSSP